MPMCLVPGQATEHAPCAPILWSLDTNPATKNKQAVTNVLNEDAELLPTPNAANISIRVYLACIETGTSESESTEAAR